MNVYKSVLQKLPARDHYLKCVPSLKPKYSDDSDSIPGFTFSQGYPTEEFSDMNRKKLKEFLQSELYIIFGASYIKGWLVKHLIKNNLMYHNPELTVDEILKFLKKRQENLTNLDLQNIGKKSYHILKELFLKEYRYNA